MKKNQTMSESELEVMKVIWANGGSIPFSQLLARLADNEKEWKRTTVLTFLVRLAEKGIVASEKKGRTSEYTALITEDEYMAIQTEAFLHKVHGGNARSLVSSLLKQDYLTSQDIVELTTFWNESRDTNE